MTTLPCPRCYELARALGEARLERDALRAAVRALLAQAIEGGVELSICDRCDRQPATRKLTTRRHEHVFCDACKPTCDYDAPGDPVTDLPHATALRAMLALLPPEAP